MNNPEQPAEHRSTFLKEYCLEPGCGGKINRSFNRWRSDLGDNNGGEILHVQLTDSCCKCQKVTDHSPIANFPCNDLDGIWDAWENSAISRQDFDAAVKQALARGGAHWSIKAS